MSETEIIGFINQIKKDYPKTPIMTDDEYVLWKDTLSKLNKDVVNMKYEEYKITSKSNSPTLDVFIPKHEEEKIGKRYICKCPVCGRVYYYEAMRLHDSRHLSIEYIRNKLRTLYDRDLDDNGYEELLTLSEIDFNKKYDEFLRKIYDKVSDSEKLNIKRIFYTKAHPTAKLPFNFEQEAEMIIRGAQ